MLRTALYIRVSTEEQAVNGLSLEAQDHVLTDYAKNNDLFIVGRYVDEGITARKTMTKRTALMRLLDDVKQDKIDLIIFTKLDRWFRNIYEYYKAQEILDAHGVNWKTIMEQYDTSTSTGRLYINIMLSIAQDEADKASDRVKVVFEDKVKKGLYLNQYVPIGYRVENAKVVKDEETQHIAEDMWRKFFECQSIRATQIYLQETHGFYRNMKNFRRMLGNPLYSGEYRGIKNFCEPYLTEEQFSNAQKIMESKNVKRTPSGLTYIFSGMLVCPVCGNKLSGKYILSGPMRSQKKARYLCNTHLKTKNCPWNKTISEKDIEEYLLSHVEKALDAEKEKQELEVREKMKRSKKPDREKQMDKIRKKLEKLKDLYLNDLIDMETYKQDYEELNRQLSELMQQEPEQQYQVDVEAIKKLLTGSVMEIYKTLSAENRRKFWRSFIDHIVVHSKDNMEIFFLK